VVEPNAWALWKGNLIENLKKQHQLFQLGVTENGISQNRFLIFFKLGKLVEEYYILLPSKPLEGDFCCLELIFKYGHL
jgi:hypothetical protein